MGLSLKGHLLSTTSQLLSTRLPFFLLSTPPPCQTKDTSTDGALQYIPHADHSLHDRACVCWSRKRDVQDRDCERHDLHCEEEAGEKSSFSAKEDGCCGVGSARRHAVCGHGAD